MAASTQYLPATYDFPNHYKGDTFNSIEFTINNTTDGVPVDLTGAEIKIQFRSGNGTGAPIKELSAGSGITVTDASNGVFEIDSFILDWQIGPYFYDIQVTFADTTVRTYVRGSLLVVRDITR